MDTLNFRASEFACPCGCGLQAQDALILAIQRVRDAWGLPMVINCAARCAKHNAAIGGAPNSAHLYGLAADIADPTGRLKSWVATKLVDFGLWMELPARTPTWAHLQVRPADERIFLP